MAARDLEGLKHLLPVGKATEKLGVLSVLVMVITYSKLLLHPAEESATLLLAIANAFGTYTVAYSILEHYYMQTLHGALVERFGTESFSDSSAK